MSHRIRIKLKSFDHTLVDKSAEKIVKTINAVREDKVVLVGPIPLPTHKKIFTVNRSTFVNKKYLNFKIPCDISFFVVFAVLTFIIEFYFSSYFS